MDYLDLLPNLKNVLFHSPLSLEKDRAFKNMAKKWISKLHSPSAIVLLKENKTSKCKRTESVLLALNYLC